MASGEVVRALHSVLEAAAYLHAHRLAHADIRRGNVVRVVEVRTRGPCGWAWMGPVPPHPQQSAPALLGLMSLMSLMSLMGLMGLMSLKEALRAQSRVPAWTWWRPGPGQ